MCQELKKKKKKKSRRRKNKKEKKDPQDNQIYEMVANCCQSDGVLNNQEMR
jgi:hypothetical protein